MDGMVVAFFVPTVLFMVIVAPAWLWMHYRSKQQVQSELSQTERMNLETLELQAERMLERIDTLEAILDAQTPQWRKPKPPE
ncbi:MAG: envelope stress response membrane protein PspB [Gammaproteobacteria bacterium]|nr:envelope stress response membrane protein PspB [Gammaproteobacteria bacterium]